MKVLSVLLVLIFSVYAAMASVQSLTVNVPNCGKQTFKVGECVSYCKGYAQILGSTVGSEGSYILSSYSDDKCTVPGDNFNVAAAMVCPNPGISLNGVEYTCNESSSAVSLKSVSLAVLFTAAIILSLM